MKNKYHNRKITRDGETFDSVKEYQRWCELKLLERAGKITYLKRQNTFTLIPAQRDPATNKVIERACDYIADFTYWQDGQFIVEDVKGYRDPNSAGYAKFVIKRKLMLWVHGIRIKEV